ncbi:MAG: tRNA (N6-isopentenyl adenosine(37)-C2)-methylthiotransferase MiaB [Deltaproteobacteria bacterium]|nr:MAG: tRNA (N6-isopentenyl adenosine(37)-C2)-methylthiotransferase MiaB [Deltaproteobacteria bacterium]
MNELDSELVKQQLKNNSYKFVEEDKSADIILVNTCSVRDLSEQKVLSRLGYFKLLKDMKPQLIIGIIGCMAERKKEILIAYPQIDLLVGPNRLYEISTLLKNIIGISKRTKQVSLFNIDRKDSSLELLERMDLERLQDIENRKQAYVRITRGCNKFCSYCVIPKTRGFEIHRNKDAILYEIKALVEAGVVEITLLGQTVNHYPEFHALLKDIHDRFPKLERLRFMTNYPRDISDDILDVMRNSSRICKYLHIPAQSGSNKILKLMNRGYTREHYLALIRKARSKMPDISIVGDMIVGFPGETQEDFEQSLSLIEEVQYQNLYIFKYSPRPDTVSFRKMIEDVSSKEKQIRHFKMLSLQQQISLKHLKNQLGKIVVILVEKALNAKLYMSARLIGRTEGNDVVIFQGSRDLIGKIVNIRIEYITSYILGGSFVSEFKNDHSYEDHKKTSQD